MIHEGGDGRTEAIMANDRFPILACHYSLDDDPSSSPPFLPSFLPPNADHMICARSPSRLLMLHGTRRPLPPLGSAAAISDVIIHLILMKVMLDLGGSKTRDCTEPRKSLGTWLREMSSCSCLTFLPGPALVLLSKICKDFFSAL